MVPHRIACVATLVLAAVLTFAPSAEPVPAAQVIDRFHATLLDVMKNAQALGVEGRLARIEPVMVQTYDFPAMAQRSLGPAWSKLDDAQRARFEQVFRSLILRTYATRFDAYTSERFETRGTEASIAGTEIVRTVLHSPKQTVQLDYRMRETPAGWRVIDVYLGGTVSELALRRAEYTSVLARDGFDALVSALQSKGAEGPAEAPASSDSLLK
ncbi:MAG: ABC transporter substrate-binding protein [Myxococcota bacterium]